MDVSTLSFDEAVAYIAEHGAAVYAFVPDMIPATGGELYVLAPDDGMQEEPWPYILLYVSGAFGAGSGEEGEFGPDEVPDSVRSLHFTPAVAFAVEFLDYELQIALQLLRGVPLDDARNDSPELRQIRRALRPNLK